MSFLDKYLGNEISAVATGDLANLVNFTSQRAEIGGASKPNSTNIGTYAPKDAPSTAEVLLREARRQKVLQLMAQEPDRPRAWYVDSESDPRYVILAFAKMIPDLEEIYTCELTIERADWDPFVFLELIDREH